MTLLEKAELFADISESLKELNEFKTDPYIFTEEEKKRIDEWFSKHSNSDDGNSGRYKMPKHYYFYKAGVIPRGGIYKGVECACGACFGGLNGAWNET